MMSNCKSSIDLCFGGQTMSMASRSGLVGWSSPKQYRPEQDMMTTVAGDEILGKSTSEYYSKEGR